MKKFIVCKCFCLVFLTINDISAIAQPAWSRGIQILTFSHDEGMRRIQRALEAEGYSIQNKGGDFMAGQKNIHSAVITCNTIADGRAYINVFVASISNDSNVPGEERVRLQEKMDVNIEGSPGVGGRWRGSHGATYDISQAGDNFVWTIPNNPERGEGKVTGNTVSVKWTGGGSATGKITKVDANGRATRIEWSNGVFFTRE